MTEQDFAVERDIMSQPVLRNFATRHVRGDCVDTMYKTLAGSQLPLMACALQAISDCVSTLESVCRKYESLSTELADVKNLRLLLWAIKHRDLDSPYTPTT